jgi:APA family basic amino acid/polyamine antiporter
VITAGVVIMLIAIAVTSLFTDVGSVSAGETLSNTGTTGMAMIFVLLTYGGWNEAVYLSAELKDAKHNMLRVLISGLAVITIVYVLINLAYLQILGMETLREVDAIGVSLMEQLVGSNGAVLISLVVIVAALSTTNATIITGARTNYAMGRDYPVLGKLGIWNEQHDSPRNALLIQGAIVLILIVLGAISDDAVSTMVDYTAPVFWFFILLTTVSIFIFRQRYTLSTYPYQVPLYPVTPLLFIAACGYLLYSSLTYTGFGALVGIGILVLGTPLYLWDRNRR